MTTVLDGLVVLELGAGSVAGSIAGMMLADNGARVVKVEPPEGDRLREQCPPASLVWNRGKESLVADLRTAAGRDEVARWAESADVVLSGFSLGRLEDWGLPLADLRAANPRLITCEITGFGSASAYSELKCYEGVVAAKAGFYNRGDFAFRDGPIFSAAPLASTGAGHMAFSGVLAALYAREETGRGQHLDASLFVGLTPTDYFATTHVQLAMRAGATQSAAAAAASPGGLYTASRYMLYVLTKDNQWVTLALQLPQNTKALIDVMGLEHTLEDPRLANAPVFPTAEDAQAWETLVWEAFRERTWAELEPLLYANPDLPYERAVPSEQGLDHPQMAYNGHVVTVQDPTHGPVRQVGPLAEMSRTPSQIARSAPALDVHEAAPIPPVPSGRAGEPSGSAPLAGVTIVEFGYFFAMPFGVSLAASLGARVVKLEDANGDPIRQAFGGPAGCAKVMEGKESLSVDLKSAEGRAIVEELIRGADAFVLGFRAGVAERVGLDHESIKKINPEILYLHSSGYGPAGPYANRPMFAMTASATIGGFQRNAGHWMDPEIVSDFGVLELEVVVAPRIRTPVDGDSNAALAVCSSLLLGLLHRRKTGEGQLSWTTMLIGNAYTYSDDFNAYDGKPALPRSDAEQLGLNALYRLYQASDGWIFVAAPRQSEWEALAATIGSDGLAGDPRFASAELRATHDDELAAVLAAAFKDGRAAEWESVLTDAGVGCAAVADRVFPAVCSTDDEIRRAGLVVEVEHPIFGPLLRHGPPVRFSETPARIATSCLRGDGTEAILTELGRTEDEIADLLNRRVVFGPDAITKTEATP